MSRPDFSKQEEEMLAYWQEHDIFQKSLQKDAPKGPFVFYEGPPTANGRPGIHHAEARAFKDCIPRFKTMQGYRVERKGGWDTHGLPVELEVEKELGFTGKKDIEEYGVQKFNQKCKENVWKYVEDWKRFTDRLGYWVDLEHAYITYDPKYVESLWWIIKQVWDKGLLYEDYRVTPHCPRCGTSLSSHELAQGYKEVEEASVYVKFCVTKQSDGNMPHAPEYLLAWTTTPWTLPSNVGLAVGEDILYQKIRYQDDVLWIAASRIKEVLSGTYEVLMEAPGRDLVGMEYEPLYPFVSDAIKGTIQEHKRGWYVMAADFVSTQDGTGIVHTAVMYGADDFVLGTQKDLPKYHLVGLDGLFTKEAGPFAGIFVKKADGMVKEDLLARNLLLKEETIKHTYPFCWRCKSPVIYYAKDSWYIRMSALREELLKENQNIDWEPEHIKEGRFGEWLQEVKDWAFSRERYWGTPLPVWVCEGCQKKICIGSFEELRNLSKAALMGEIDPHRPFVDDIVLSCPDCSCNMKRVKDVCDVWFDSGCMPFAQGHYPFEEPERIDKGAAYPADYICEAIDQTRGWFYTLLAVSTLLQKERPFKHVICLGHVLDAKGKKMSKSQGNTVDPFQMMNEYGADAVRWYMYTINQPGDSKRFDVKGLDDIVKKVFMILWNVQSFYEMYADERSTFHVPPSTHILDKWILASLDDLIIGATSSLDGYKIIEPARAIGEFISDLSTWYLRRSRDRFKGENEEDKQAALATLRFCLLTLSKLMAPFTPFLADRLYQKMGGEKESVHLEEWPVSDNHEKKEKEILTDMVRTRSVVSKILDRRTEVGIPVKQVLAKAFVTCPEGMLEEAFAQIIKDEVNVKEILFQKGEYAVELDLALTPELIREGTIREITRRVNAMRKNAGLTIQDRIELVIHTKEMEILTALTEHKDTLLTSVLAISLRTEGDMPEIFESLRVNDFDMVIGICKKIKPF